ncbi:LysR family transcriptional regulator [Variovorax sp. LjRoot178]|uniref:LysR family transcriptional regulator n=1 Tax=Variovorax sp. LjRoot178 TaxID=3342277 RepID=UPI003ECFFFA0
MSNEAKVDRARMVPMNVRTWIRKLDLMTLRLFASITEERNIGRAAVRESIAPSAVTKRIQQLEDTLGFRLMYRDPKGTRLTAAGAIVDSHVKRILGAIDDLHHELGDFVVGVQGHVRLWANASALAEYLAEDLGTFSRNFPSVTLDIDEGNSVEVEHAVASGIADVGICSPPLDPSPKLSIQPYRTDRLVAVVSVLHPLANAEKLTFLDLLGTDLIGSGTKSGMTRLLEQAAAQLKMKYQPKYRVASGEAARSLVRAGLGVAIQPSGMVWPYEDAERVRSVPITDKWAERDLCILTLAARPHSVAVTTLTTFLTDTRNSR